MPLVQLRAIQKAKGRVERAIAQGYFLVQVDEAVFFSKRNTKQHWAPKGSPLKVPTFFSNQGYKAVCAAINHEHGFLCQIMADKAFNQEDMVEFLELIQERSPPR